MADINTDEFMRAFDKMVERTERNYDQAFRAVALQLFAGIVKRWPVDTGRSRGNWQISLGSVSGGELNRTTDPTNAEASKLSGDTGGRAVYLHNNVPYAERLENGWSSQAPSGAVRVTLTEFESALRRAAQDNQL